jgi:putative SOS response-associated peptidase YedK
MFSRMQLLANSETIVSRFNASEVQHQKSFLPTQEISGFEHASHPIIIEKNQQIICDYARWGLVPPDWRKEPSAIWNHTISAKLEYLNKRYAWQKVTQNRCLIPATAYFEYHWNDPKGNSKTKFIIKNAAEEVFALAGLFSVWRDQKGDFLRTFAVCTTKANDIMETIHNKDKAKNYHRMPVMLNNTDEKTWLDTSIHYMDFAFPNYRPHLITAPVNSDYSSQGRLF